MSVPSYINDLYQELLGRRAGQADMDAGRWAGHSPEVVRAGITNSQEFQSRQASSAMSSFMHGFGSLPSGGGSSALDGILKKMYESQLGQSDFMFDSYKKHQLPYETDYLNMARGLLPAQGGLEQARLEEGTLESRANMRLIPHREATELATMLRKAGEEGMATRLIPYLEDASKTHFQLDAQGNQVEMRLLPYRETMEALQMLEVSDRSRMESALMPYLQESRQTGLQYDTAANQSGMRVLPYAETERIASALRSVGEDEMATRLLSSMEGALDSGYGLQQAQNESGQRTLPAEELALIANRLEAAGYSDMAMRLIPAMEGAAAAGYGLDQARSESGQRVLPHQEMGQIVSILRGIGEDEMAQRLIPYMEGAAAAGYSLDQARSESGQRTLPAEELALIANRLEAAGYSDMAMRLIPAIESATRSDHETRQMSNEMMQRLMPNTESAQRAQLGFNEAQALAATGLIPQETELYSADMSRQQALMPHRQQAQETFFQEAHEGVDPNHWAARAGIDVAAGYAGADSALRRDAARMGVDPSSGRFAAAQGGYGLNMAKDLAQARTLGRRAGEDENWNRQTMAANYAK